jgi:hypothetical protein
MSGFVDDVRREWKRLGVPDAVADEMAAELQADLDEAAHDGVSPTDLLGTSANDPRGFAAAWANERGLVAPRRPRSIPLRWVVTAALVLLAIGVVGFAVTAKVHKVRVVSGSTTQHQAIRIVTVPPVSPAGSFTTVSASSGFTRVTALIPAQEKARARHAAKARRAAAARQAARQRKGSAAKP